MAQAPLIDPRTVFLVAMLMILLNGGLLGLMHRSLAPDVQPSADSWRIATLLHAAACVLQAVQSALPAQFVLPLANACLLAGLTGYWRALRQFHGLPDRARMLLPALLGTAGVAWFAADPTKLGVRIVIASLAMAVILLASARTLQRHGEATTSRRVLTAMLLAMGALMLVRALLTALAPPEAANLLQLRNVMTIGVLVVVTALPVVGTTAFVLMCLERIRGQWQRAASLDWLTGLANRRTVALAGERVLQSARRGGGGFAVGLLDVDHFKRINDHHGHEVGDRALRHLAERLAALCRGSDLAGRVGGEEFVVLWDGAGAGDALAAAARLQEALREQPLQLDGAPLPLTVSIGIAVLEPGDAGFEDLLRRADRALYAAKAAGRDRVELAPGAPPGQDLGHGG